MLYLFNNQLGFDKKKLGFPSVDSCNAIVYQTDQGLCGLHNYGGEAVFQYLPRATTFASFAQECNMQHASQSRNLYSVINKRYLSRDQGSRQEWINEMTAFATALKFKGTVHLIALIKNLDGGSVYIQYNVNDNGDGCDIRYKKWSKMELTRIDDAPPTLHELKKDMSIWNSSMGSSLVYDQAPPTEVVGSVNYQNSGESMHRAINTPSGDNSFRFSFSV